MYIHVPLFSSCSGISGQVPVLYTWQYHTFDKCCITIPSSQGGRRWAGGGVSLILLIVAIILVACRRESVMRSQVDVLLMQMKTLAEENKRGKHVRCTCVCMYAHMCLYVSCFFFLCD